MFAKIDLIEVGEASGEMQERELGSAGEARAHVRKHHHRRRHCFRLRRQRFGCFGLFPRPFSPSLRILFGEILETKVMELMIVLNVQIDGWHDIALSWDYTKPPRVKILRANSVVTDFGNEYETLSWTDALFSPGLGSGPSNTEASSCKKQQSVE
ncbi:uncharacterized protein LOC103717593 [Phoenix dactylifera]|uniref:Uncharacterized protein LOC103717593 n=1 Tax=Phoenix dactylifera TaxID=42345 RepID=A0A8B8ZMH2_PHODC|nr:uncharacterized protein LOC103717593 [Phoenix dactylifera]